MGENNTQVYTAKTNTTKQINQRKRTKKKAILAYMTSIGVIVFLFQFPPLVVMLIVHYRYGESVSLYLMNQVYI